MEERDWASDEEEIMEEYASSQMNIDSDEPKLTDTLLAIGQSRIFCLCRLILQGLVAVPDFNAAIGTFHRT